MIELTIIDSFVNYMCSMENFSNLKLLVHFHIIAKFKMINEKDSLK